MTYAYGYIARGHIAATSKLLLRTYWNQMKLTTAYHAVPEDNVLRCLEETDENLSDDIHIDKVENEHTPQIGYIPVCTEWQKDQCNLLGLPFIHGIMGFSESLSIFNNKNCS